MHFKKQLWLGLAAALVLWVAVDLLVPRKNSLRNFDPVAVGQLEAEMWRSYYEHRRSKLFFQLSTLMRRQFNAPFWRSFLMAYQAAKAAAVFQDGSNREEYALALPFLEKYFSQINELSDRPFDVQAVAKNELEWWVIRREPEHTPADWERVLAIVPAELYHLPAAKFAEHAHLRVQAMVLRDSLGTQITEADWAKITDLLEGSWCALHREVNAPLAGE